jgi:hypothetical protein
MKDTDPDFFNQIELLGEAARLKPGFDLVVVAATTEEEIDELVRRARVIVMEASEHSVP